MSKELLMISEKGKALLAAVDAGLCKEKEGKYDTEAFERFWSIYSEKSAEAFEQQLAQRNQTICYLREMLDKEREQRANDSADYRIAQRRNFFALIIGFCIGGLLVIFLQL